MHTLSALISVLYTLKRPHTTTHTHTHTHTHTGTHAYTHSVISLTQLIIVLFLALPYTPSIIHLYPFFSAPVLFVLSLLRVFFLLQRITYYHTHTNTHNNNYSTIHLPPHASASAIICFVLLSFDSCGFWLARLLLLFVILLLLSHSLIKFCLCCLFVCLLTCLCVCFFVISFIALNLLCLFHLFSYVFLLSLK